MKTIQPTPKCYVDERTGEILHDPFELNIRPRSIKLTKHFTFQSSFRREHIERGEIKFFSNRSRLNLSELVLNTRDVWTYFFTLTYHQNLLDGKKAKKHLNTFFTYLRRENLVKKYIWVLEFQKRGSIHFHFFVDSHFKEVDINDTDIKVRSGISERFKGENYELKNGVKKNRGYLNEEIEMKYFKRVTYLWLLSSEQLNDEKAVMASTDMVKIYNANFVNVYASKYLHKVEQKTVPRGCVSPGRFWGASRGLIETYVTFDQDKINEFRKDLPELLGLEDFTGKWLLMKNEQAEQLTEYVKLNVME